MVRTEGIDPFIKARQAFRATIALRAQNWSSSIAWLPKEVFRKERKTVPFGGNVKLSG
jgi:hypothetical protein